MKAYCLIRPQPWYRREAFAEGLRRAGFAVVMSDAPDNAGPDDVLVIWNRYGSNHDRARHMEARGGRVWVAENGYINADGSSPKFAVHPRGPRENDYYAIGDGYHNDSTRIVMGEGSRFAKLGLTLKPWRECGDYILVCPNRSFGAPDRIMPPDWAERTARTLGCGTLPVRIRAHPGNDAPKRPLAEDLKGAAAVAIWSSTCGVHALLEGIVTWCDAPAWVMREAACLIHYSDPSRKFKRAEAFERLAWGQWTVGEIARGEPFSHLLSHKNKSESRANLPRVRAGSATRQDCAVGDAGIGSR